MKNIFSLNWEADNEDQSHAYTELSLLEKCDLILSWTDTVNPLPFKLQLVDYSNRRALKNAPSSKYKDYQRSNLLLPLLSEKFFTLIKPYLGEEKILWIKIIVASEDEERMYYIPRFLQVFDVLDLERSTFASDYPLKTVFLEHKITNFNFICIEEDSLQDGLTLRLFCSDEIRKIAYDNKLTGMTFEQKGLTSIEN